MDWREIEPWEPEESVGKLWHGWAARQGAAAEGEVVALADVAGRLAVLFRGLGGPASVELRAVADTVSRHRLGWRRRLGTEAEVVPVTSFDGAVLRLPARLAVFPAQAANAGLYVWLAAAAAFVDSDAAAGEGFDADRARLASAEATVAATLAAAPGLRGLYAELAALTLAQRPVAALPPHEVALEARVRRLLGDPAPVPDWPATAPRGYRAMRPCVLWPLPAALAASDPTRVESRDTEGTPEESAEGPAKKARRRAADMAERRDSLILHKFEAILSWAEFLNLNRRIEDDDDDSARKAADDQDEIGLGQVSKAPATRLKLHLDLAPEDADREAISGVHVYPEWDARAGAYLRGHVRVLEAPAEPGPELPFDPAARRRIRAVRRRFEALRPARVVTPGHRDGDELDLDAVVRSAAGLRASGEGSDRVWRQARPQARDLSVAILLDTSRSTESAVGPRSVIEIEREALAALAWGLDACGDRTAIWGFHSLRRERVFLHAAKGFDEAMSATVERRIAGLAPRFYTRLGAGIRHASARLAGEGRRRRLLIVITDGKPNDLDHYEGRHGIEDSAMAVREARRAGQAVFGITVDRSARTWFPRIFGRGGHALVPHPDHLLQALPGIYREITGA